MEALRARLTAYTVAGACVLGTGDALAGSLAAPMPIGSPDFGLLLAFIAWGLLAGVAAVAIRNAFATLAGGLLHLRLRRFGIGLAAPPWARVTAAIVGAISLLVGWYVWMHLPFAAANFILQLIQGGIESQYAWCVGRTAWVGVLVTSAWLAFWLGKPGAAVGAAVACSVGWLLWSGNYAPDISHYAGGPSDPIAGGLCVATLPLAVWLARGARLRWPATPARLPRITHDAFIPSPKPPQS